MPHFATFRRPAVLLLFCTWLSPVGVVAQAPPAASVAHRDRFWISAGLGLGRARKDFRTDLVVAANVSATYQHGVPIFSIRTAGNWGIIQGDVLADVALLAGVGTRAPGSHVSIAIGPAMTSSTVDAFGGHPVNYPSTLGAAAQVQLFGIAFHSLGFGLSAFGNLNRHQSFGGITLALSVGTLPP